MSRRALASFLSPGATWALHLGDCIEALQLLPDRCVDHTIFDPPYEEEAHTQSRRIRAGSFAEEAAAGRDVVVKPISYPPITAAERAEIGLHVARVTRRWIVTFSQVEAAHLWRAAFEGGGAEYVRTGSWHKTDAQPQLSGDRPGQGWEAVVICHGARAAGGVAAVLPLLAGHDLQHVGRMRWNGGGHCATWRGPSRDHGGDLKARKLIDGQKPLWLMKKLVEDFTDAGELVADFTAGGGTTGVACLQLGRRFVGWERKPEHYEIALKRLLETSAGQQSLALGVG